MAKNFPRTGKRVRPKTAVKGKRYLCAKCRKRSPKPVKTPAPWYCPTCLKENDASNAGIQAGSDGDHELGREHRTG
jgi:ribosomal protein L37AE/L43A